MKLTFERAILIVLIVIIFLSTSEVRVRYTDIIINMFFSKDKAVSTNIDADKNRVFPNMLLAADRKYNQGDYEGAAKEYFSLTLISALSIEQKTRANFRLGMCQFYLKNYKLAYESFLKVAGFSPNDSVIYNNAAVSAYWAKDMKSAIEYQTKALAICPAVEYYYNLARMYEDNGQYDLAVNNYVAVAKAEQNLTETDKIDPVRVKEKVARLMSSNQASAANDMIIGLKLKGADYEVLTVNENEMQIKSSDFTAKVENQRGTKNIVAEYDRKKNDPYNLISEMVWTVYKNGKQLYKKVSDKINVSASESGNYEVRLSLKYNDKEKISSKTVRISSNQSTIDKSKQDDIIVTPPIKNYTQTYEYAIYEQLFENDFNISSKSYTDRFNVVWGKDSNIEVQLNKKLAVDKVSSLVIDNKSGNEAGLWINLDSLLTQKRIKGKVVKIGFYAREITNNADINVSIRVKSNNMIATTQKPFKLAYQFEQKYLNAYIPEDVTGLTISITIKPNEQINIDGFTIVD